MRNALLKNTPGSTAVRGDGALASILGAFLSNQALFCPNQQTRSKQVRSPASVAAGLGRVMLSWNLRCSCNTTGSSVLPPAEPGSWSRCPWA